MATFLIGIPPLRVRTLAELRIGETIKNGVFENGVFTPKEKMQDPTQAVYYFDMKPKDYKTGKIYGDYCVEIPNYRYQDGSYFYDYLDSWLCTWRQELLKNGQSHNYLFVRIRASKETDNLTKEERHYLPGDPVSSRVFQYIFSSLTKKFTGARIGPHIFRAIWRTHYASIGASKEVMDALAYFMQHSSPIADEVYDRRTSGQRCQPLIDFLN